MCTFFYIIIVILDAECMCVFRNMNNMFHKKLAVYIRADVTGGALTALGPSCSDFRFSYSMEAREYDGAPPPQGQGSEGNRSAKLYFLRLQ
eukprot:m.27480 g.27480  ORF g.27480 m.27480 type:complete len:91 (+) comp7898_c0_seq2:1016-1288(+)